MALIVEYHVVADMYPVGSSVISAGMLVGIDANGLVIPSVANPDAQSLGVAGDSALTTEGQTTAYSAQIVLGADGAGTRWTSNRVSDFYNETTASQKITVYNGGGKFWISDDLFDNNGVSCTPGLLLGSGTTPGDWTDTAVQDDDVCGLCVGPPASYPSGVPGTDTDGHIALAAGANNTWIPVVVRV